MLVLLPLLCWLCFWSLIYLQTKKDYSLRESFLLASVAWGFYLTSVTEILSVFSLLNALWLSVFWLAASIVSLALLLRWPLKAVTLPQQALSIVSIVLAGPVGVIVLLLAVIAWLCPPNNGDSMTTHMTRVVYWMQAQSVAHYPTHNLINLFTNPGAGFIILHLQILSGGDRLVNFVQWFSMIGCLIGVSLLAQRFKADALGQVFSAVIAVTIPMGILQSTTTQTDYVAAFWLVCFVYLGVFSPHNLTLPGLLATSASLALGILTKGTIYFYALPFCLWLGYLWVKAFKWQIWKPVLILIGIVLILNAGFYLRNSTVFASPLGPAGRFSNEVFTIQSTVSNIVRNIALHLSTSSKALNSMTEHWIRQIHLYLGTDIDDPRTTWAGTEFRILTWRYYEGRDGNLAHLILILTSVGILLTKRRYRSIPSIALFSIAISLGFLLFCFFLKWQPYGSRLHLPLFILWAPVIASVISKGSKSLLIIVTIGLILFSWNWIFYSSGRPLLGEGSILTVPRTDQYLRYDQRRKEPYSLVTDALARSDCRKIGLIGGEGAWMYPFWVQLNGKQPDNWLIWPVNVSNSSAVLQERLSEFVPCAIVYLAYTGPTPEFQHSMVLTFSDRLSRVQLYLPPESTNYVIDSLYGRQSGPEGYPLVTVSRSLAKTVGVSRLLVTPWPIATHANRSLLWLGHGEAEGIGLTLWATKRQTVEADFVVRPGPARPDKQRTIEVTLQNRAGVQQTRRQFDQPTILSFTAELQPGRNEVLFYILDEPTILKNRHGDTRLVRLGHVTVRR